MKVEDIDYIEVRAGVRYWEDAEYNGEEDINLMEVKEDICPKMPFARPTGRKDYTAPFGEYEWCIKIEPKEGKIIGWPNGNTANIHYKTCDDNTIYFFDKNGRNIGEYECYVPDFLCINDEGYGDYIIMQINEDGIISDWLFTDEDIDKLIKDSF